MIRCAICGCSRLDNRGMGCILCFGSPALRTEQVHVTEATKAKLIAHATELGALGVKLEKQQPLQKDPATTVATIALALHLADSLESGVLRKLIRYLWGLGIPQDQILRLRLDEPESISKVLKRKSVATQTKKVTKKTGRKKTGKR